VIPSFGTMQVIPCGACGSGAYARRRTEAAAAETRTSHRPAMVMAIPAAAPRSLSRQARDSRM